jgi:hypothetical protein
MSRVPLPHRPPLNAAASMAGVPASPATEVFCGHCGGATGKAYDDGASPASYAHPACRSRLQLEPPRYCLQCGRRLKVQVTPLGWEANCSRHGQSRG